MVSLIECICLQAPFCRANSHTDAEHVKKDKPGTWRKKKNHCPPLKYSPHEKMRAVHGFLNHSYGPMNSPWKYNREGITQSSGNIQINYKQGLVCWKLGVQECLSTIQQVYSSFEAWQGSLCWGEAIPFEMWKFPVRIKMTSSWQPTDVSTQTGPSRASRRKVVKTPSKEAKMGK